jgi:hypothetical protein
VVEKNRTMALQLLEKHIKEVGRRLRSDVRSEGA